MAACNDTSVDPEPEREWINVRGTYRAVSWNGKRVVDAEWFDSCPDSMRVDGEIVLWVGGFTIDLNDGEPDPSRTDEYRYRKWTCGSNGVFGAPGEYRSTADSLFTVDTALTQNRKYPPLPDGKWLDSDQSILKIEELDDYVGGRAVHDVWIFERCSDEVVERGEPRPEGCP